MIVRGITPQLSREYTPTRDNSRLSTDTGHQSPTVILRARLQAAQDGVK